MSDNEICERDETLSEPAGERVCGSVRFRETAPLEIARRLFAPNFRLVQQSGPFDCLKSLAAAKQRNLEELAEPLKGERRLYLALWICADRRLYLRVMASAPLAPLLSQS